MFFCKFVIISHWKRAEPFIWTNLNSLQPKMICAKLSWYWPTGSGEDFLNLSMYFRNFVIISPWKRARTFILSNLNPLHPRIIHAKFGWNWTSGSGEEDFKNLFMYLSNFEIISPWKIAGPFLWTNLNPLHPRIISAKFGRNSQSGSIWRRRF